jgi:predicted transcriptional regulator
MEPFMRISPAESRVMDLLWERSPLAPDEIVARLTREQDWGEATVKTLINRLLKKGAIRSDRHEGRVRYSPLVGRDDYVQAESQDLLDRLFGGELTPLVAHFAGRRKLTPEEAKRLKALVEQIADDD